MAWLRYDDFKHITNEPDECKPCNDPKIRGQPELAEEKRHGKGYKDKPTDDFFRKRKRYLRFFLNILCVCLKTSREQPIAYKKKEERGKEKLRNDFQGREFSCQQQHESGDVADRRKGATGICAYHYCGNGKEEILSAKEPLSNLRHHNSCCQIIKYRA